MRKETYKKICKKCKALIRKEDTEYRRIYRIKVKEVKLKAEKVKIKIKKP